MSDQTRWWIRFFSYIPLILVWLAAASILCMAILIGYDVMMRYFFNSPTSWAIEIAQYLMLVAFFSPLAYVQQKHEHIKVELFIHYLPPPVRKILSSVFIAVLILIVNSVLLIQVGKLSWKHLTRGTVSATILKIPLFPLSMILVIAFFATVIITLFQFNKPGAPMPKTGHTSSTDSGENTGSPGDNTP
jgi:C4-dicarboxylate transporter DctQ subunit